jgi:protein AATF/BFR2
LWEDIVAQQDSSKSRQDDVIQQWSERIKLASGALSHRKFKAVNTSILSQIERIWNDRARLVKRTQQVRGKPYKIFGKPMMAATTEMDEEIFDDTDFYQQLLKEIIESKAGPDEDHFSQAQQWLALKQLQAKHKKLYPTKTTKGRQMRYTIHEKLVNFMLPSAQLRRHQVF